ncbi:MAG: DNA polymerase II large subunit, partial [Candidatus Woesearchaeota archaeon]
MKTMQDYFRSIEEDIKRAYKVAESARKKGYDPEQKVDMPIAKNMAERVEGLVSSVAPQIVGSGIPKRIQELEKKYGSLDWRISLIIALEIAQEKFCKFNDKKEAIEVGIRVGFAYHTMGTVASPLEGFTRLEIKKTKDNKDYFAAYYSGPIRSAGGTGASVSVLIIDYVRKQMGYAAYDPTEKEIKRLVTELYDYHERITNLQYLPSPEEIGFLAKHIPIQITGDPSEKIDVSNYKDLERVETNKIRNGVCLTLGEGIAQKAPKVWAQLSKWGNEFGLEHWGFLKEFVALQKEIKSRGQINSDTKEVKENAKIKPDFTFIKDLVAGRPILTMPLRDGGFRLRYGRCRTSGFSSCAVHPATTHLLNQYISIGSQLKMERPGKATVLSTCDTIDGPIIMLNNGNVVKITSETRAKKLAKEVKEILFLGDILINYGDFYNRAHKLIPPGYCEEWWVQELEKATVNTFGSIDTDKLSELVEIPKQSLDLIIKDPLKTKISADAAISLSNKLKIPLHPAYTYHWNSISFEQLKNLVDYIARSEIIKEEGNIKKIISPLQKEKRLLELIGLPHSVATESLIIEKNEANALITSLGLNRLSEEEIKKIIDENQGKGTLDILSQLSEVKLRDKSGVFIGARMGRPEKAKQRHLTGSPQVLFPVGEQGGKMRSFQSALEAGKIRAEFPLYYCSKCNKETIFNICLKCDKKTKKLFFCKICGNIEKSECKHGKAASYKKQEIDIKECFESALNKLSIKDYPDLIKGVRGTSNKDHIPEHIIKGILRAKHNIYVNKDGTTRYDMTQLGITHFKPKEIGTHIAKLKELGYEKDINNLPLEDENQLLEIKPQDVILPSCYGSPEEGADKVLFRVSKFIDELLTSLYGLDPFYNLENGADLAGHLILGLAPHTSAAIAGRIIGFSKTQGYYAHPLFHAAHRRDLDGDESCVILLMDALLNFSRQFLPAHRGSTQDAPLVLTSKLIPSEVDDMVFDMDVEWKYPLEFYEACLEYKNPWDLKMDLIGSRINTDRQYSQMGFTHNTDNMNAGVRCSAYKTLPSMEEKLKGQ